MSLSKNYEYQVYVARTDHREDESKALEIEKYLRDHSIDKILYDIPGQSFSQKILFAALEIFLKMTFYVNRLFAHSRFDYKIISFV
jgi:hypothetical protein